MTGKKILIVDDEEYVLKMIALRLEEEGYEVRTASTGNEGIQLAADWRPDMILMDIMMEDLSGLEAVKTLKNNPATATIPVIILSGKSMEEDRREAVTAGAEAFISKPILPNRLIQQLKRYLA